MQEPTQKEILAEATRIKPWLFNKQVDCDLSCRRYQLCALQEAEDNLRARAGLPLKYSEE